MTKVFQVFIYLFILFILWILIEAQVFRVRKTRIKNDKIPIGFNNFKIVFISDIHYGRFFRAKRLIKVVNRINKLEPDIIIIGGDYLDVSVKSNKDVSKYLKEAFEILKKLESKLGIFTVLGNHDYSNRRESLINEINTSSFKLLKNTKLSLDNGKDSVRLIGMDDLVKGYPEVNLLKESSNVFTVAISHNPDFFSDYKNLINYDLGFSGHTHGGQVTFFGLYAPNTSSKYGQRYLRDIVHEKKRDIVLTKGIGNGTLPIRFFAVPEIVEISLVKK